MDAQEQLRVLMRAATQGGVVASALSDVLRRGLTAFQERPRDAIHARQWAEQLRSTGPHGLCPRRPARRGLPRPSGHGGHIWCRWRQPRLRTA